jgi:sec-independent protein translocase protein TatB
MMPGVGFAEMVLLVLVAVVVVGPKDLPLMMRKFGRFTGKMRAMAFEFKQGFDELGRQAELEELRKEVADLKKHTGLDDIQKDFEDDARKMETDVNKAMTDEPKPAPSITDNSTDPATAQLPPEDTSYNPGYDTVPEFRHDDDFRLEGHPPEPKPAPASDAAPEPAPAQPAKQDTTA